MAVGAIQYYGIESVVQAYENKQTPAFAIWAGKTLHFRYDGTDPSGDNQAPTLDEGAQLLAQYLEGLWPGSTATYTLKTYDELKVGEKIRPSTEYDTAFCFRLTPPEQQIGSAHGSLPLEELRRMNARIEELAARDQDPPDLEDDDGPETLEAAVIGLINQPEKLRDTVENIRSLVELGRAVLGFGSPATAALPATVGVVRAGTGPAHIGAGTEEQQQVTDLQRMGAAIDTLQEVDPDLVRHLEQLAKVARENPARFRSLLTMLDIL